jgi:hypothetical protein
VKKLAAHVKELTAFANKLEETIETEARHALFLLVDGDIKLEAKIDELVARVAKLEGIEPPQPPPTISTPTAPEPKFPDFTTL